MPQKLTTTACFIQEESSGGKQFRYDFNTIQFLYVLLCLYVIEHSFVFRKPKLYIYIYLYIYYLLKIIQKF